MTFHRLAAAVAVITFSTALLAQTGAPSGTNTSASFDGLLTSTLVFMAGDADKDGVITRAELDATISRWFTAADAEKSGSASVEQLTPASSPPTIATSAPCRSSAAASSATGTSP